MRRRSARLRTDGLQQQPAPGHAYQAKLSQASPVLVRYGGRKRSVRDRLGRSSDGSLQKRPRAYPRNSAENTLGESPAEGTAAANGEICRHFPQTALCPPCKNIFKGDPDRYQCWNPEEKRWIQRRFKHHTSALSFGKAIIQKCYICTRVRKAMSPEYREMLPASLPSLHGNPFSEYEVYIADLVGRLDSNVRSEAAITILLPSLASGELRIRFVAYSSKEYKVMPTLSTHTSSTESLDIAKKWFYGCSCGPFRSCGWTPTRLLDIGNSASHTWKLCIPSEDNVQIPQYITLSYRWGDKPFIKLTAEELRFFRAGKPILDLPQTFQDAVVVAKHFGIRYIWIDSLCIIQDSEADIAAECSVMSTIYTNSSCNLVAISSKDPFGSLFRKRNYDGAHVGDIHPIWINLESKYRPLQSIDAVVSSEYFGEEIQNSPLRYRGWILQEMVLAPRAIHFGENQLYWECCHGEKCETFPDGVLSRLAFSGSRLLLRPFSEWEAQHAFSQWEDLIMTYSRCVLLKSCDKLIALSGLAQLFQKGTGDTYLAGLWKSRLPRTLHWGVFYPHGHGKRAKPYRAPTWSWASLEGPIWFMRSPDDHESVLIKILDWAVQIGFDLTGTVFDGKLTIQAPARTSVPIMENETFQPYFEFSDPHVRIDVYWDEIDRVPCDKEYSLVVTKANAVCVDFLQNTPHKLSGNTSWSIYGIVLRNAEGEAGKFLRVGCFALSFGRIHGQSTQSPELALFGLQIVNKYGKVIVKDETILQRFEVI